MAKYTSGNTLTDPAPEVEGFLTDLFSFFINLFSFLRNSMKKYFPSED